uniref:Uncharacterized protein n=1 Tax=Magallana gigas TaxID=29159 RepID=A0A8W8M0V0_MAGGI
MPNLSDSSSENENVDKDIVQLFASDSEVDTNIQNENADRPNTRSVASTSTTGKGKGISSNKRGKAPAKKRTEHVDNNNNPCTSGTTGENPEGVIEYFPDSDFDHVQNNETDMFSIDNDPEVVFDDDNSEISMPKIFEDETKFSESISKNMAKFIKMGCTQKADVSKYLDEVKIPENCKNLVPPLINSEIWNNLFPNVQQRDKTLQDAQRILGLSIVPMISLAEMFKTNKFEMKKAKKCVSDAITLACNAMYELNVRRRFILRPFVHKRFQQLCAATTPIEEKTLFPSDITKRMKEISDASKINKQLTPGFPRNIQSKNFRGKMNFRGRTSQYNPYSRGGGRSSRSRGSGYNRGQGRAGYNRYQQNY